MNKGLIIVVVLASAMLLAAPASADWNVGDGHKMHFPQLPDPNGWDVDMTLSLPGDAFASVQTNNQLLQIPLLADDFQCSQTDLITDVHFWASWRNDDIPVDSNVLHGIATINLAILDNVPDPSPSDPNTYSQPGAPLWVYHTGQNFTVHPEEPSPQGWYDPVNDVWVVANHSSFFQYQSPTQVAVIPSGKPAE